MSLTLFWIAWNDAADCPFKEKKSGGVYNKLYGACLLNFVVGPGELMLGYSVSQQTR